LFFVLTCSMALFTSRWWLKRANELSTFNIQRSTSNAGGEFVTGSKIRGLFLATTILILLQLMLGATMRHQHAGLAIHDFPLAYGKLWPATDPASVALYNEHRIEITNFNPITGFQIVLQMIHRIVAVLILCAVAFCAWGAVRKFSWQSPPAKLAVFWLGLILCQVALGAATVLSDKAADVATGHVIVGALSLATGVMISIIALRFPQPAAGVSPVEAVSERQQTANLDGVVDVGSAGKMPTAH
jgi:heme A synthase